LIKNLVVKVSSEIIALRWVIDENHDKLNVLNANMNMLIKHVVGNENMKYNKDTSNTCGTPYDVHPSKLVQKKKSHFIKFRRLTRRLKMTDLISRKSSISQWTLNFQHL